MESAPGWLRTEMMGEDERRHALAHELGVPFVVLGPEDIADEALELLPEPLCRAHNLAPYRLSDDTLEVAVLDLADVDALEPLRPSLGYKIAPRLSTRESVRRALLRYQKLLKGKFGAQLQREADPVHSLEALLRHAAHQRASEVHLESDERGVRVAYRHGKSLRDAMALPASSKLAAAVRDRAKLGSRTLPQEGRFAADLGSGTTVAVRVSSLPTMRGERLVLRMLRQDAGQRGFTLEGLGLRGQGLRALRAALEERRGLVLVAGGPGSGKTTLLYTMLDMLNDPTLSFTSVEERPAARLPHVAQTRVSAELSMAAALRAALRQDPDVVMVEPVADRDTFALAAAAARRGMLVLASLSARDAMAAYELLQALGVTDDELGSVTALVGTGLVRRLCERSSRDSHPLERRHLEPLEPLADFGKVLAALKDDGQVPAHLAWKDVSYPRVTGCSECEGGYRGKMGVFEVITGDGAALNLVEDALSKAASGLTSAAEVLRFAREHAPEGGEE